MKQLAKNVKFYCGKTSVFKIQKRNIPRKAYRRDIFMEIIIIGTALLGSHHFKTFGLIVLIYLSDLIAQLLVHKICFWGYQYCMKSMEEDSLEPALWWLERGGEAEMDAWQLCTSSTVTRSMAYLVGSQERGKVRMLGPTYYLQHL